MVLESSIHGSALPYSVAVRLGFWNSEHDETRKWAKRQQVGLILSLFNEILNKVRITFYVVVYLKLILILCRHKFII